MMQTDETQRILADAGAVLGSSLDYTSTLERFAQLAVPALGECCVVDLVEDGGALRRMAVGHCDPAGADRMRELSARFPLRITSNHPIAQAISSGKRALLQLDDAAIGTITRDEAYRAMLREMGFNSALIVPLAARGLCFGAVTFYSSQGTKRYGAAEIALAEELARRASASVDNARLYEAALVANKAKADFLAVISHELRTPLTTIMGYTDLLLTGLAEPLGGKANDYVTRVRSAAWHLLSVIEQILIYARLDVGREEAHPERVGIGDLLRAAAALIEPVAGERGINFVAVPFDEPVMLETDVTKLRQILLNLLSNAVKFTDEGSVTLRAELDDDSVVFFVEDTGIGIAPENVEKVFNPFWQVDQSSTRSVGGAGLGLSVTRRLARLLGGEVSVDSKVGKGSIFHVRIPLKWRGNNGSPILRTQLPL